MKPKTAGNSVKGLRPIQQDRYGFIQIKDELLINVIADGNGGEGGGELAEYAIRSTISKLCHEISQGRHSEITSEDYLKALGMDTLHYASRQIMKYKISHENWTNAGTTITLILITKKFVGTFWIGDSCAYLYQNGCLIKLTSPVHTIAEMLIENGETREISQKQPGLNSILTRCAGHDSCEPDSMIIESPETYIVMAGSDGVFGYLSEAEIVKVIREKSLTSLDVQEFSDDMIQLSLKNGSDDNCTLITTLILPHYGLYKKTYRITKLCEWYI